MITYFEIGGEIISSDTPNLAMRSTEEQHEQSAVEIKQAPAKTPAGPTVQYLYMPYRIDRHPITWLVGNAWFSIYNRKAAEDPLTDPLTGEHRYY